MTHYVVIGTGVTAISAANTLRKTRPDCQISLIGEEDAGYYSRPGLAYYLSNEIPESSLFPFSLDEHRSLGARWYHNTAAQIDPIDHSVLLDNKTSITYDKLLIASGASSIRLRIPGIEAEGVHKLDHLEDARGMIAKAKRGKTAIITGGGITALEIAEGLASRGMKVHYVLRGSRYWSNVLDEYESNVIEEMLVRDGIQIHHNLEVCAINQRNGKVSGVELSDGTTISGDLFAYAIGIKPRIDLAKSADISCDRGILVNKHMQTNHPDIYAAGDVAQVFDPVSEKYLLDSLWNPAREQGHAAALNMSGNTFAYERAPSFNVTRLAGLTVTIIGAVNPSNTDQQKEQKDASDLLGIARGDSETWLQLPNVLIAQGGFEVNRVRLMVGEKYIFGAIVMGDQKLSALLQTMIREKIDISSIRCALLTDKASIADILIEFWRKLPRNSKISI